MRLACVVLAAGLGKRMKSPVPKVLHTLSGRPMLQYVLDAVARLKPERTVVVVGTFHKEIADAVEASGISFAHQREPRGTGDALMKARDALSGFRGTILVLNGDTPLITPDTLRGFLRRSQKNGDALSVLSFSAENPEAYGRIVRDDSGVALQIVEEKDATAEQKRIAEVNGGIYAISSEIMDLLSKISLNKAKGEYYLTDLFSIARQEKVKTGVYCSCPEDEMMGINTRAEMLRADRILQTRIVGRLVGRGVTFINPASVYIHSGVMIGSDTVIYPNVYLEGETKIGRGCVLYPNVRIAGSAIGDGSIIKDSSVIERSTVKQHAQIGPFAHLRPASVIGSHAKIGNFVEIKKSVVGAGTKASHLSYIGDAVIGKDVNIGAGTITCNYDGKQKHKTEIHDGVFIGSDTQLVAPVKVGRGAYVAAGSTVTKDVPPLSLAISRTMQKNIKDWAKKRMAQAERRQPGMKGQRGKGSRKGDD
ncbi:MAG TPA: bifunctional UDP-N-acetylglucosamine diphosphorylase/glucosamine-1-phosphate N-acetyltransferase GlmU [Thermodesulfovibrionales bacterium]|nr:bifunctional UDP-N-acetylglucosamine diphosphorylase/glucosamine-1-phosphate N-acetyltransferase GlmU [Thermodesulfovibrionales bacterium]